MSNSQLSQRQPIRMMYARLLAVIPVLLAMFVLTAGTFAYWEAWVYLAILFIPSLLVITFFLRNNPELLERRTRTRETETEQKLIKKIGLLYFFLPFLLPGFDQRLGWSNTPAVAVIVADALVLFGYGIIVLVLRENLYLSGIVEVAQEQKVISSGLYAIVRHPMYVGVMLMYILSPLALGSYWAMIPAILVIPSLVARIQNEESVLARELKGYQEYMQKTKYRLIPGIW